MLLDMNIYIFFLVKERATQALMGIDSGRGALNHQYSIMLCFVNRGLVEESSPTPTHLARDLDVK
jgi:hypothetical protein